METHFLSSQTGSWTNEKHSDYLNSMEASFVRAFFENQSQPPRMDRFLPDTSDSTQDLKLHNRKKHSTLDLIGQRGVRTNDRDDRRSNRRSSHPYNPAQDQVVPQMGKRAGGGARDERDHAS